MRLPQHVEILGTQFAVVQVPMKKLCGEFEAHKRLIRIDSKLTRDVALETFYHELVHAILAQTGVADILSCKQEEAVAQSVGMGMFQFLSKNGAVGCLPRKN